MNEEKCRDRIERLKTEGESFIVGDGVLVAIPFDYCFKIPDCVELLSQWRIENPSLSPTRFPVSNERTENWLQKSILNNPFREMFMIQNTERKNIGHIGISEMNFETSTVRIDSVMKGVKDECPGIMALVIGFLKTWCKNNLEAEYVDLVVLDDNIRAIKLYMSCGFSVVDIIPLKKQESGCEINWIADYSTKNAEKRFLHMICKV